MTTDKFRPSDPAAVPSGRPASEAVGGGPGTTPSVLTRVTLVVTNEEPIHPEIVRDDLAAVLDAAGYDFFIKAESVAVDE